MNDDLDTAQYEPDRPSGRHRANLAHLVMGVAFIGLAMVWGGFTLGWADGSQLRWFLPLPWIAAGIAGLVVMASPARRRSQHPGAMTE